MKQKTNTTGFDFKKMLLLFALVPLLCGVISLSIMMIGTSSKEVKTLANNSMLSLVRDTGVGVDNYFAIGEQTLQSFISAPIVKEYLKNPNDAALAAEAQQYTVDFFGSLDGWEGIYIADWNSKVLTHPAPPVIGKVMREGDRLKELQDAMLASDGVYNVGIITSPASGELIVSMYAPVYDGDTPIGYVGAGTFISETAANYADVTGLNLKSAYTYFVDHDGIMIAHPDAEKIGNPVENEVVKGLVADIQAGKHPDPKCVVYEYKGATKYAAYYVGVNESYVAVLTADEADVLAKVNSIRNVAIVVSVIIVIFFIIFALVMSRVVVRPLKLVMKAMQDTAEGDLNADTDIHSIVYETIQLIESAKKLQGVLQEIIGKTKDISDELNVGAEKVTDLSGKSLDSSTVIANTVEELADGAISMAESVQNINEKIITMGEAIDDITDNTDELTASSNKIKVANADAVTFIGRVAESSDENVVAVQNISQQIMETNEAIERIQNASDMITDIANQTNLLALNASIEAARAGEAGKGFAVVADEIKNLSAQSNDSAEEIKNIVREIVEKSDQSVRLSAEVSDLIAKEKSYISETQSKFEILNREIEVSLEEILKINSKVDTLNESKGIIISEITDLSAISEENAASNQQVSESVHEIEHAFEEIVSNASETKDDADQLKTTIDYFS